MKKNMSLALLAVLTLTACGTMGGLLTKKEVVTTRDHLYRTNLVSIDPFTGIETTSVVNRTNVIYTTNVVYEPNPKVTGGIETAQQVSSFLPPPYGTAATVALTGLSALLGIFASYKNKKAASATDQVVAVVRAIEGVSKADPKAGAVIKNAVKAEAGVMGVQKELHETVKSLT